MAVDDISFQVEENEIFGLLRSNGSGKTTTQRMLCSVLEPSSGVIKYHGKKLGESNIDRTEHEIGYVPKSECLYGDLLTIEKLHFFGMA